MTLFLGNAGQFRRTDNGADTKHKWPTEIGGKTSKEWIKAIAQPNRSESVKALKVVLQVGPKVALEAVPTILAKLKKHKPKFGTKIDASFVSNAPAALAIIMSAQEKPESKTVEDIVKVLKVLLKDPQITIRYRTLTALGQFGPYANGAVDEIIALVRNPDTHEIRQLAVTTLGHFQFDHKKNTPPKKIAEALLKYGIHDPSTSVRMAALHAVVQLDLANYKETKDAVEEYITQLLFSKYPEKDLSVRITAHMVAYGITPAKNKARRDAIAGYLASRETSVCLQAMEALSTIGPDAKDQALKLEVCTDKKRDLPVRFGALQSAQPHWLLGQQGQKGQGSTQDSEIHCFLC